MKINKLFLGLATIAAAVFSFSSCSSEDVESTNAPQKANQIRLTTNVALTRSVSQTLQESQIANNVHVGAFVTNTGSTTEFLTNATNNDLTANGSGDLTAATGKEMYFPKNGNVDIYAYAPYNSDWTSLGEQTFTVQTNQSEESAYCNSDLIWATPLTNQVSQVGALALAFKHKLSKINVTITNNRTGLSLNGATVSILNTKPSVSINLSTGNLGSASGTATEITAATLDENETTASAIIVPQEVAAGKFIKIVTNGANNNNESITLYAKLDATKTLAENHKYNYTVTINDNSVELKLGSTTIGNWTAADETAEAEEETPAVTYAVGDYVLKDGSLLKANASDFNEKKSNIVAVIFSTSVSSTDATAGYNGYAVGLQRYKPGSTGMTWYENTSYNTWNNLSATNTIDGGFDDLDGRTKSNTILNSTTYSNLSENTYHIANLTSYSLTIDADAITNGKLSGWFTPSYGQVILILNELGGAKITKDKKTYKNSNNEIAFSNQNTYYQYSADEATDKVGLSTIITNLEAYRTAAGITEGSFLATNVTIATVTENSGRSGQAFWQFAAKSDDNYELTAAQAKVPSAGVLTGLSVWPVVAFKLPSND